MDDKAIPVDDKAIPVKKDGPPNNSATIRKDRLAEQLRANLQKRKAQSRSRRTGDADQRPDGLAASKEIQKD
ncbi:hypothetical protein [Mesorhizobium sp. M7A.F.Ca.US.011.01.1.1]|uniref:hypothetical protein n=1 Tax=Mesorhizobium sp. M7A.F.Ca.US.011.01.1.1 TaxID=2496741 RepID=UPI001FE2286A|nr:hypothetical protein [Mesorhizobium sp. M7A.F.Ca.US.011.01.1.1]